MHAGTIKGLSLTHNIQSLFYPWALSLSLTLAVSLSESTWCEGCQHRYPWAECKVATIVAGPVIAGELSLMSAIAAGNFVYSNMKYRFHLLVFMSCFTLSYIYI